MRIDCIRAGPNHSCHFDKLSVMADDEKKSVDAGDRLDQELADLRQNPLLIEYYPVEFLSPTQELEFGLGRSVYLRLRAGDVWYQLYVIFTAEYPNQPPMVLFKDRNGANEAVKPQKSEWSPSCTVRSALTKLAAALDS